MDPELQARSSAGAAPAPTTSAAPAASASQLRGQSYAQGQAALSPRGGASGARTTSPNGAPAAPGTQGPASLLGGSVAEAVDGATQGQLDLQSVSLGFSMPAGRTLSSSWSETVSTRAGSHVNISVDSRALTVQMNPGLYIDAIWPAQNMQIYDCGWNFQTGRPWANVSLIRGLGEGFIDKSGDARQVLTETLSSTLGRSAMGRPGYNPATDASLMRNVTAVMQRFQNLPPSPGAQGGPIAMQRPSLSATLAMRRAFNQSAGDAGVQAPAGGTFSVTLNAAGDLGAIASAQGPAAQAAAARLQSLELSSDSLTLVSGGRPVAKLQRLVVGQGGRVELREFEALGSARTGSGIESLIRILAIGAQLAEGGVPGGAALEMAARSPGAQATIVPGITRAMIEDGLTQAVQGLIRDNRTAIPGIDLASVFGVR